VKLLTGNLMLVRSHDSRQCGCIGHIPSRAKGKNVMKALRALMLVLALCVCTYAGDMPNGATGNMPNDVAGNMPTVVAGNMETGVAGNIPCDAADPVTEIALNILQSVLPLF
jgi:hypothetical protein